MLFENQDFSSGLKQAGSLDEHIFRYCEFAGMQIEGGNFTSTFLACCFTDCEWYWGLFNTAIFVDVKFLNCTFLGTGFSGVRFINCEFENCSFLKDNLGGKCAFNEVSWFACTQKNCNGLEQEFLTRDNKQSYIS
ncbi:pentapeptide repeat-containing protein [Undibacterium sp. Di27W]|uniref:pentapeptide repeat-containing protein n=1 Tax=Undibacterium sp. Di27W TaxID=3413036 RepID=UPI003BF19072